MGQLLGVHKKQNFIMEQAELWNMGELEHCSFDQGKHNHF